MKLFHSLLKKAVPVMEQPELLKNEPKQNSNWKNFSPRKYGLHHSNLAMNVKSYLNKVKFDGYFPSGKSQDKRINHFLSLIIKGS